ncbi:MAG: YebC/PmpR family DNA-binding transcriptional regulator, partial [Spirochaetaceae bacterium]|nr:YebC/PmpR family DNA-binding transcriptional regulator [Spirochaetaceae bacterium]
HSKWSTIKRKKGATDAKRGQLFTKLGREIVLAAREGGDPTVNFKLRLAIDKAKSANMPKDNIERAIKKGTGALEGSDYQEMTYEGYGPSGVAIMADILTDNRNRTAADVRSIFSKHGGNLGESGCVSYLFNRKGILVYDASNNSEDEIFETALDAGASDVTSDDTCIEVVCEPDDFESVLNAMQAGGFTHESADILQVPDARVALDDEGTRKALRLIEALEDYEDIQEVSSNIDIPDDFEMDE